MAAVTLARAYQHSFDTHPYITLAVAGGCLNALGDCVAQVSERTVARKDDEFKRYEFTRTLRFFCYGFVISPFLGRWNTFLESRFPLHKLGFRRVQATSPEFSRNLRTLRTRRNGSGGWAEEAQLLSTPGNAGKQRVSWAALTKRVAADQLIMAPIGLVLFIGSMGMMEGRTPRQIKEKYRDMYHEALVANWKVWPLAQLINFRFMPLPYRVPFSQTCGVFWTLYLSMLNAREDDQQDMRTILREEEQDWKRDAQGRIREHETQNPKIL
ncbi:hypothetical protein FA15DRAFT_670838 [Coprinopsis marcescibilis]|uniref:Integral membrane protein n=1 Tax=Coprinopsis marcescibilis TaxID=230819 RepID=A0A5C3KRN6_COPMA|nr:hypothetical protein FA15DRAFT_670838 [Coprinopsis marcescibilis]